MSASQRHRTLHKGTLIVIWPAALAARSSNGVFAALLAATAAAPGAAAATDATDHAGAAAWAAAAAAVRLPRSEAAARRHPVYVLGG